MADIKDMLSGVVGKVMDMAQTSGVADKVKGMAESSGVKDVYLQGAERVKAYGDLAKLTVSINNDSNELKRVFAEIGRLYYEEMQGKAEDFYAPLFSQVEELSSRIKAEQDEVEACRARYQSRKASNADIEVEIGEFEEIVDASEPENTDDIEVEFCDFDDVVDQTTADAIIFNENTEK